MAKSRMMPFDALGWLTNPQISAMNPQQRDAYFRLLCLCWVSDEATLPCDISTLADMSGLSLENWRVPTTNGAECILERLFPPHEKAGFRTDPTLYAAWIKAKQWSEKSRAGGMAPRRSKSRTGGRKRVKGGSIANEGWFNSRLKGGSKGGSIRKSNLENPAKSLAESTLADEAECALRLRDNVFSFAENAQVVQEDKDVRTVALRESAEEKKSADQEKREEEELEEVFVLKEKANVVPKPPLPPKRRPTLNEVRAYCQERGNAVDPEMFFDFYEANGWTQGRGKAIKDWQAAVRTWERSRGRASDGGGQKRICEGL